jgi:hypothetical protein
VFGVFDKTGARTFPTLESLSTAYGIPIDTLFRASSRGVKTADIRGGWKADRGDVCRRIEEEAERKRIKRTAENIAKAETRHLTTAAMLEKAAAQALFDSDPDPCESNPKRRVLVGRFRPALTIANAKMLTEILETALDRQRLLRGQPQAYEVVGVEAQVAVTVDQDSQLPPEIRDLPAALRKQFMRKLGDKLAELQTTIAPPPKAHNRMLANDMQADEEGGDGQA